MKATRHVVLTGKMDFGFTIPMSKLIFEVVGTTSGNVYPLKLHFYIEKLWIAGVYLFILFLFQNIDCGYSLKPLRYPQSMF